MAKINIYVPDPLMDEMKKSGKKLNWSHVFQTAMVKSINEVLGHELLRVVPRGFSIQRVEEVS